MSGKYVSLENYVIFYNNLKKEFQAVIYRAYFNDVNTVYPPPLNDVIVIMNEAYTHTHTHTQHLKCVHLITC